MLITTIYCGSIFSNSPKFPYKGTENHFIVRDADMWIIFNLSFSDKTLREKFNMPKNTDSLSVEFISLPPKIQQQLRVPTTGGKRVA
jgi:hypothetical protein